MLSHHESRKRLKGMGWIILGVILFEIALFAAPLEDYPLSLLWTDATDGK